jgi:hypothetical protein
MIFIAFPLAVMWFAQQSVVLSWLAPVRRMTACGAGAANFFNKADMPPAASAVNDG